MFFFFKQKTAYEMRISDWSSDVCSSDLTRAPVRRLETDDIGRGKQINIFSAEEGLDAFVVVVRTRGVTEAALPTLINKLQQCIPGGGIGVVDRKGLLPLIENDENYGLHARVQSAAPTWRVGFSRLLDSARTYFQ